MGSGKTYKMQGTDEHPGLMPLAMSTILSMCEIMGGLVEISYYEVYLDWCYDLLEPKAKEISVLEDKDGRVQLKGLSKVPVHSMSEFHEIFSSGIQRRKVAHTGLNNVSSRSHGVLMIVVSSCHDGSKSVVIGKLNLIDLAGDHLLETGLLLCTWAIFITLDMMVGRSFPGMMLESFTTNTTQLFQALLNKKWMRWQQLESI